MTTRKYKTIGFCVVVISLCLFLIIEKYSVTTNQTSESYVDYESLKKLYKWTFPPSGLPCGYSWRETNYVGKISLGTDLYLSYQRELGITGVRMPVEISQEIRFQITQKKSINTGMSMELPFFIWFSENLVGTNDPQEAMEGLCYLTYLVQKAKIKTLQIFIVAFLDSL